MVLKDSEILRKVLQGTGDSTQHSISQKEITERFLQKALTKTVNGKSLLMDDENDNDDLIIAENAQADWDETDINEGSYIKNKPTDLVTTSDLASTLGDYAASEHTHIIADITDAGDLAHLDEVSTDHLADKAVTLRKLSEDLQLRINYTAPKKLGATRPPTQDDDETDGWEVGSVWIDVEDTITGKPETYRAVDVTEGAAVWIKTSLTSDELGTMAFEDKEDYALASEYTPNTRKLKAGPAILLNDGVADQDLTSDIKIGVSFGSTSGTITEGNDSRLTLIDHQDALDGTDTDVKGWSSERVHQVIEHKVSNLRTSVQIKDSDFTAVDKGVYAVDTSVDTVVVSLPSDPDIGCVVKILDYAGSFHTNNCKVDPGSENIMGNSGEYWLDIDNQGRELTYVNQSKGWLVI